MKLIRRILFGVSLFLATLLLGVLAIAVWPQILINSKTLEIASHFLARKGIDLQWKDLEVHFDSLALLRKRMSLKTQGLCVHVSDSEIFGCSTVLNLSVAVSFARLIPNLIEIGPVLIQDLKWSMGSGKKRIQGRLDLQGSPSQVRELEPLESGEFQLSGYTLLPDRSKIEVRGLLNLEREAKTRKLSLHHFNLKYFLDANFKKSITHSKVAAHLEGELNPQQFLSRVSGLASGWLTQLPRVSFSNCQLALRRNPSPAKEPARAKLQLECPLQLEVPVPPKTRNFFRIPSDLGVLLEARLNTAFPPSIDEVVSGVATAKFEPLLTPLIQGQAQIETHLEGIPSELPNQFQMEAQLGLNAKVHHFENLVRTLEDTVWAVPAPLNVLNGNLNLNVNGKTKLNQGQFPIQISSRLSSKTQKLDLDGLGDFKFNRIQDEFSPELNFNLTLSQVQLEIPRLDWAIPPQLFPDDRIGPIFKSNRETKLESQSAFNYKIHLRTPQNQPIKIVTNLAQAPIPVGLDLHVESQKPLSGVIQVGKFPVEVFRRKALLDHFDIQLAHPIKDSSIDGLLRVDYADYQISLKALSTIDKPRISATSDPPLPENQVYAALLFGRQMEELNSDQAASVGDARAAFADGAVSLASLFVFASTPIQSLGYDESTKSISAKVRLGEGTSLNIGSASPVSGAAQNASAGIQKRLGRFWTITTDLSRSDTGEGGVASAYLEWSHRY